MNPFDITDEELEIARRAVEDTLVEFRDSRISVIRNNGLVIREYNSEPSSTIRMGIEDGIRIGLAAIEKHRLHKKIVQEFPLTIGPFIKE